jgi:uncharacterized protein with NRDE domain
MEGLNFPIFQCFNFPISIFTAMCLILLALNYHPKYKMIIATNRDEFYNRKTAPAEFWKDHPDVLAGRDLEAMGTWLGVTRTGRLAMLTNFRDPKNINPAAPSRGKLVSDFLVNGGDAQIYVNEVSRNGKAYNGFNLITGTVDELWYYSNYGREAQQITDGLHGLSNHLLDTPWPKVVRGKEKLAAHLLMPEPEVETFFKVLYDEDVAPDNTLPNTGLPLEHERALSSMFIKTNGYGSRCTTVIMVDRANNVFFSERVYNTETFQHSTQTFRFTVSPED